MTDLCSFVIPCYNEEGNVEAIYQGITELFRRKGIETELVMVNDGSTDETLYKLRKLYDTAGDEHLKIVSFSRNFGKDAAILSGLRHTTGRYVCIIDADLQQPPEVALQMYEKLESSPELDCVAAFQENRKESKTLRFFKDSFYKLINRLSETKFRQGASDFRMCRRNMIDAVLSLPEYHRFSKGIFSWVGFNTFFMPYEVRERNSGVSKWSFSRLFSYALGGIMSYSTAPLMFSSVMGISVTVLSLLYLIVILILAICGVRITFQHAAFGFLSLLGGIQLISVGIIGGYLSRTYIQGKGRPLYIEKEVLERKDDARE